MKVCVNCGKKIADHSVFCNYCGAKQPEADQNNAEEKKPVQKPMEGEKPVARAPQETKPVRKTSSEVKPVETKTKPASSVSRQIQEKKEEQTKAKKGGGGRRFLTFLICATLIFTGFIKPGFIKNWIFPEEDNKKTTQAWNKTTKATQKEEPTQATDPTQPAKDSRDLSQEVPIYSDGGGNSKAFRYSPIEGIEVSADEGAFDEDTEIRITPVTQADAILLNTVKELEGENAFAVAAFEVDAGLNDDAQIPGVYNVSIDLNKIGIPEALQEDICAYRIADDGSYYEYASMVENGKLTYSSDQNSVVAVVVRIVVYGLIIKYGYGIIKNFYKEEFSAPFQYFYDAKKKISTISRSTANAKYRIHWNMEDLVPDSKELMERLEEITRSYSARADELYKEYENNRYYDATNILNIFDRNKSVSEVLLSAIENDPEYQEISKRLTIPEEVEYCITCTDLAFQYLKGESLKLPTGVVEISSRKGLADGVFANATPRTLHEAYVEVDLSKLIGAEQVNKDNFLLTMTHELLHVCQALYRYFWADSNRFDEMVAVYAEPGMLLRYQADGIIDWDSDPELSSSDYWTTLKLPVDTYYGDDETGDTMRYEGYNLGAFLTFLKEKTGKTLWLGKIMRAKSSIREGGISKPLMNIFEISEAELDVYYRTFMRKYKTQAADHYDAQRSEQYKRNTEIPIVKGGKYYVEVGTEGSYSSEIRGFTQKVGEPISLVLVPDEGFMSVRPECNLVPVDKYELIQKGAYVYPLDFQRRDILEIHGALGKADASAKTGYTVYAVDKTKQVIAYEDEENLILKMPENSYLADDNVLDGYVLTLEAENDVKFEKIITPEFFEKEYRIPKKDIYKDVDLTEALSVNLTLCEFLMKNKEEKILLEPSESVEYVMGEVLPNDLMKFNGVWIPIELKGSYKSSDWVLALAYIEEDNIFGEFEGPGDQLYSNSSRWIEIREFDYDPRDGILVIDFDKNTDKATGTAEFYIKENGDMVMKNAGGSFTFYRYEDD